MNGVDNGLMDLLEAFLDRKSRQPSGGAKTVGTGVSGMSHEVVAMSAAMRGTPFHHPSRSRLAE